MRPIPNDGERDDLGGPVRDHQLCGITFLYEQRYRGRDTYGYRGR